MRARKPEPADVSISSLVDSSVSPSASVAPSVGDRRSHRPTQLAQSHEVDLEYKLEQLGFLPTKEDPALYRALGKNGFGLFLHLSTPLDLRTLNRLAKCTDRTAALRKCAALIVSQP